jgi:hypothetical protein
MLDELVPEGSFAGGEEGILAGVPAEEMRGAGVGCVMVAGFPDFVEEEGAGLVDAAMQVESQAAIFLARGSDEGAKFGFKEKVLGFFGAHHDDEGDGVFRKLEDRGTARTAVGKALRGAAGFALGHDGRDCTPNAPKGKRDFL